MLALAGIGTLVTAACFYPGYLNGDSNWQYAQGLSGEYDDMHPVVMSWLWGRLDYVIEGSGGIFLLMAVGFWTSLGVVLRSFTSSLRGFVIAAILIGASIPVFSMVSQIHKDLGMVVGLLGGFGLLVEAERRRSLGLLLSALPLLWYALAVRHNGAAAVLPFTLWMGWMLPQHHLPSALARRLAVPWRRVALGIAILATLFASSLLATRVILGENGRHTPYVQALMAYDLVGISVRTGRSYVSDVYYPQQPLSISELRSLYSHKTGYFLYWGQPERRKIPFTRAPQVVEMIRRAWLRAIVAEPRAYWAHRSVLFLAHLGIGQGTPVRKLVFSQGIDFDYRGPTVFEWPHARALISFFERSRSTVLFCPWPYLVVGVLALAWAWLRPNRHRLPITLLATSAATYIAPLLFVGVSSEFRYMWWPILAAMLQVALLLSGRGEVRGSRLST